MTPPDSDNMNAERSPAEHGDAPTAPRDPEGAASTASPTAGQAAAPRKWLKRTLSLAILLLTLLFVSRHIVTAASQLQEHPLTFRWSWIALVVVNCILAQFLLGIPWWMSVRDTGANVSFWRGMRAFLISYLGRYVPGKAMVPVIRYDLLRKEEVTFGRIMVTTIWETADSMAAGSAVAAISLFLLPLPEEFATAMAARPWVAWASIGLTLAFGGLAFPPALHLGAKLSAIPFKKLRDLAMSPISLKTFLLGIPIALVAWIVFGISYWATLNALRADPLPITVLPMTTTCVSLSVVIGFISMIPGQAGVREWILIATLIPVVGEVNAVAAALLYRLLTLVVESTIAAVCYLLGGSR